MRDNGFCQRMIEAASARPGNPAMTLIGPGGSETTTFGEALSQIRSIAYRLTQEQIGFGDRVALIGENHPHWAIAYLGILYRGAVAVPLDQAANTTAPFFLRAMAFRRPCVSPIERSCSACCRSFTLTRKWSIFGFPQSSARASFTSQS